MRIVRKIAVGVVIGLMLLPGCASSEDDNSGDGGFSERYGSNLAEQARTLAELEYEIEEYLFECMSNVGFDVPRSSSGPSESDEFLETAQDLDRDEFVERYGYGIVAIGIEDIINVPTDPWSNYRLGLSEPDRLAFDRALNGEVTSLEGGSTDAGGGCVREAETNVRGGLAEEQALLIDLEARVAADQRFHEVENTFVECMQTEGFDEVRSFDSARDQVNQQFQVAVLETEFVLDDGSQTAILNYDGTMGIDDVLVSDAMDEVRVFELDIASAEHRCRLPLEDDLREIREPYENEFMADLT
jgi:hypothetical protein